MAYAEILGTTLVIRGPPAAQWAINLLKKIMDKKTADKIHLFGWSTDPRGPLSDFLDAEVLSELEDELRVEEDAGIVNYKN